LLLGWIFALIGCLASVIGFISSISTLIKGWQHVTDEMIFRPFIWVYAIVMNGALSVVFRRASEAGEKGHPR